jgi:hypothetical protein
VSKQPPLSARLYFQEPLYGLARIVGYQGLPVPRLKEEARPLLEKYGKERMERAAAEVVWVDTSTDPPTARLQEGVRKLCRQLLGPPPETREGHEGAAAAEARAGGRRGSATRASGG